jgi:hypothetical protein
MMKLEAPERDAPCPPAAHGHLLLLDVSAEAALALS